MFADPAARVATALYVVAGVAWALLSAQPGAAWIEVLWFVIVGAAGGLIGGIANQVSLARAYLSAPALVYAWHGVFGPVALVVALAGLSDLVDGTVARRFGHPSNFGGGLDPVVDGLFMGALGVGLALGSAFPLWLALVVIARYLVPAAAGGLLLAAGRRPELRHTLTGQISTTLILVLLGGLCLFRGLGQDPGSLVPAAEAVIPIATLATFVHLGWAARGPKKSTLEAA